MMSPPPPLGGRDGRLPPLRVARRSTTAGSKHGARGVPFKKFIIGDLLPPDPATDDEVGGGRGDAHDGAAEVLKSGGA